MAGITRHNSTSNHTPVHGNAETPKTTKNYSVYESKDRTSSQSAKSKLKNLAYTLSRPFRSLMKGHIEKSIGTQNSMGAMKNINAQTTSIRKTEADSTSTPKTSGAISTASGPSTYKVVGGQEGHRSPTLAERFWG
jgi:hypothetical protein